MPIDLSNLAELISTSSKIIVFIAIFVLLVQAFSSTQIKHQTKPIKKLLFTLIVLIISLTTLFLVGSTLYLNAAAQSHGPVHYHADLEIYQCGKEITIVSPTGLSNKVGTATLHTHNDKRIHVEGVVVEKQDISLGKFFKVIGGAMVQNLLTVPTDQGLLNLNSGQDCPDGTHTQLQVFVYKTTGNTFSQTKIPDPGNYLISPQTNVPPGDCIIVELDNPKDKTDKLCRSYQVAQSLGKIKEAP